MPPHLPSGAEALERGEFPCLAYRLGRQRATGVLTIGTAPDRRTEVLVLRRGQLMAEVTDALGRQTRRRLAYIASLAGAYYTFDSDAETAPADAVARPFSLAGWARSHFEAQLDTQGAQVLVEEFTGVRMVVVAEHAPDASLCDATDRRILDALKTPMRLDQVWHQARTPRFRLLAFLYFLRCVGALELVSAVATRREPLSLEEARRILGVSEDADADAVKRAYRRLARALHPDLHPHASDDHRRALERRLAAVTSAYAQLTQSHAA